MLLASLGSSALSAAFGALGGAVVALVAFVLRRFEEERDRKRRLQAAARLVDEELRNAFDAADAILAGEAYASLPVSAWEREGVRLAAGVEFDDWLVIAKAYDRVNGFNWRVEAGVLEDESERRAICEKITRDAPAARRILEKHRLQPE